MKMKNIFTLNDWDFKSFAFAIILIQILMLIVSGISLSGVHLPIFNDIITLLYLGFIPGIIILRILKLHDLGNTFTTLLADRKSVV